MIPPYWEQAKRTLSKADPVMKGIIRAYHGEALASKGDAFHTLARSIVGQQISVKAADTVWRKLEPRIENRELKDEVALRACGLSRSKVQYLKALAEFFAAENIQGNHWDSMSDEEVIRHITQVKGIGRWSAEMFLIFHLLRPDVFPVDDIGLQKAIKRHYALESLPLEGGGRRKAPGGGEKKSIGDKSHPPPNPVLSRGAELKCLTAHAQLWQPYRSVATWYLWRSLDPVPVEY